GELRLELGDARAARLRTTDQQPGKPEARESANDGDGDDGERFHADDFLTPVARRMSLARSVEWAHAGVARRPGLPRSARGARGRAHARAREAAEPLRAAQ